MTTERDETSYDKGYHGLMGCFAAVVVIVIRTLFVMVAIFAFYIGLCLFLDN